MRWSAAAALLATLLCLTGCATVTQEDPPSHLDGAGGSSAAPSGSGAGAGTAPIAATPAPEQSENGTLPGPVESNIGSPTPAPPVVSNSGGAGAPSTSEDAGPQFASGTELLQ